MSTWLIDARCLWPLTKHHISFKTWFNCHRFWVVSSALNHQHCCEMSLNSRWHCKSTSGYCASKAASAPITELYCPQMQHTFSSVIDMILIIIIIIIVMMYWCSDTVYWCLDGHIDRSGVTAAVHISILWAGVKNRGDLWPLHRVLTIYTQYFPCGNLKYCEYFWLMSTFVSQVILTQRTLCGKNTCLKLVPSLLPVQRSPW